MRSIRSSRKSPGLCPGGGMVKGQIEPCATSILSSSIKNACHPVCSTCYGSIRADQIVRKLAIFLSLQRKHCSYHRIIKMLKWVRLGLGLEF